MKLLFQVSCNATNTYIVARNIDKLLDQTINATVDEKRVHLSDTNLSNRSKLATSNAIGSRVVGARLLYVF